MFPTPSSLLALLPLLTPVHSLTIAARQMLLEASPIVLALEDHYPNSTHTFINGLPDLWQNPNVDLDAGAEVHVIHDAPAHPDLRIIASVAEVYYRIVANKSVIRTLADFKGKKIGVVKNSTSEYFAYRFLKDVAGLKDGEYTLVAAASGGINALCYVEPCGKGSFPYMLKNGEIDAVTAYEPTTEMAIRTIGENNAVVFRNDSLYRELSVMYTTKAKLEDPVKRKAIVEFLRALGKTQEVFAKEPKQIWARVAKATTTGASAELLEKIWPFTRWTGGVPDDMVDILTGEDQWAAKDVTLKRGPMSRERWASHVDDGPWKEALAGL